jgi:hypothetical protein
MRESLQAGAAALFLVLAVAGLSLTSFKAKQDPADVLFRLSDPGNDIAAEVSGGRVRDLPSPSVYAEITQRPPFSRTRRPFEPELQVTQIPPETAAVEGSSPPQLALVGVALDSRRQIALFRQLPEGLMVRVVKDEFIDNWQLVDVGPRQVILQSGSEQHVISLYRGSDPGSPAVNHAKRSE